MAATQLTSQHAEQIAESAAIRSLGFGPQSGTVTVDVAEIIRIAQRAAMNALEAAGRLDRADKADRKHHLRLANAARARHDAWKKETGLPS